MAAGSTAECASLEKFVVAVGVVEERMHGERRRLDTAMVSVQSGIAAETTAVAHCVDSFGIPGLERAGIEGWQCHMVVYRVVVIVIVLVHLGHCSPTVGSGDTVVPASILASH